MSTKSKESNHNSLVGKSGEDTNSLDLPSFSSREIYQMRADLFKKIHQVQAEVETVGKSGRNTQQNYDYTMEEDILKAIKPLLKKHKLIILQTGKGYQVREVTGRNGVNPVTRVCLEFEICDIETGYSTKAIFWGEGFDPLDKGVYKAYTGAVKYMLAKTFLLPTSDDPENDQPKVGQSKTQNKQTVKSTARQSQSSSSQAKAGVGAMSDAQKRKIFALIKQKNFSDDKVKAWIKATWKIESSSELYKRDDGKHIASKIIEVLDKKPANPPKEEAPAGDENVDPSEIPADL